MNNVESPGLLEQEFAYPFDVISAERKSDGKTAVTLIRGFGLRVDIFDDYLVEQDMITHPKEYELIEVRTWKGQTQEACRVYFQKRSV